MKRVTGLGGVFFKAKDPKALYEWYRKHLGIESSPKVRARCGAADDPRFLSSTCGPSFRRTRNILRPASRTSCSTSGWTISDELLKALREEGVQVDEKVERTMIRKLRLDHGSGGKPGGVVGTAEGRG